MYSLRSTAKTFTPGVVNHVIKRVTWHSQGITDVKEFDVVEHESLARGRKTKMAYGLHKTHAGDFASKIRDQDEDAAIPFKVSSFKEVNDVATEYLHDNLKNNNYNIWVDNSEYKVPGIPPVYTAPLYRSNTCKGVPLTTPPVNITEPINTIERINYCDN